MEVQVENINEIMPDDPRYNTQGIGLYRRWFRDAVDYSKRWQEEAREDYDFVGGRQWDKAEIKRFEKSGRPAIVINRIRPLLNLLSGYQRVNRLDIDFLGRTPDDSEIAQVRKGVTKYILDTCDYDTNESAAFIDSAICGLGWLFVGYEMNEENTDGEIYVRREDPFGIYVDPESHKADFSDAKYICRAKWVDKEELKEVYPEHAEMIDAQYSIYDNDEGEVAPRIDDLLWYKRELQKVRVVECWYKTREKQITVMLATGEEIPAEELTPEIFLSGLVVGTNEKTISAVKVCVFFDKIILEEMPSPYEHGELPIVCLPCYYYGIGGDEIPAGFVRDLKDAQREINKRRIQALHVLNTTGNGGGFIEDGAMSEKQFAEFAEKGNLPGHYQRVQVGTFSNGSPKIVERQIGQFPAGLAQAEAQTTADLTAISGINEALLGTDLGSSASGRAIELKQRQAATHLAVIFDNLRATKKKIARLLWGKRGRAGLIPQFFTAEKVYRIEGANGQKFVTVNQQVIEQDPIAGTVVKTLNDLSQGEFDIVISDISASTTHRQAQLWTLIDGVSKLGVPGDLVFDIVLDLSDIPNKEEIKNRWRQRQESQAKAAQEQLQMQIQLEEIKNRDFRQTIAFKDAPLALQMAMAAKAGYVSQEIADYFIQAMLQQLAPDLAAQMQQQAQMPPEMQQEETPQENEMTPEQVNQLFAMSQMMNGQPNQNQGGALTQAATESLMRDMSPAV